MRFQMPKFLLERWTAVRAEDVHLATIRVYTPPPGTPGAKPRFVLFLPPNKEPKSVQEDGASSTPLPLPPPPQHSNRPTFSFTTSYVTTGAEPDCYELDMVNEAVENQIVVAERPKDPSLSVHGSSGPYNSRARTTILTGRIKHECNLRPSFSETYRKQMRGRHLMHNTKSRQIKMIEETGVPRGGINRLSSGVGVGSGGAFSDLAVCILSPVRFVQFTDFESRKREQNHKKGLSAWLVSLEINFLINSSLIFAICHTGVCGHYVTKRNNLRRTSRRCCQRSHSCIAVASIMECGNSRTISRMKMCVTSDFPRTSAPLTSLIPDQSWECPC